ncbi:hypothetical protein J6G99_02125 [bacterium]|nr:hypothetical protein [bacterium]
MIKKVELGSVKNNNTPKLRKGETNFTGLGDIALKGVQMCEQHPMVNVSVLDLSTAILPRTFFETFIGSKKKDENGEIQKRKLNLFGGFEAFRRESSGLIINCLIPSFLVIGTAKLLNKPVMGGFNKSDLTKSWANSEVIDNINSFFLNSKGTSTKERIIDTLKTMTNDLHGADGKEEKAFKNFLLNDPEFDKILEKTADNITNGVREEIVSKNKTVAKLKNFFGIKSYKNYTDDLYEYVLNKTGIAENIKFSKDTGYSTSNLKHLYNSTGEILSGIVKENIAQDSEQISKYITKAKRLVNAKSAFGLIGLIIPLAISAQPINRWITHKLSGKSGAPIYNDDKDRHLTSDEKKKLTAEKFIAVPLMWGVAGLSMLMDRPSLKMFQFKNIFPTMDQARIISAATFSSRIAASEDSNELKESTIRDIATFSSFYFLGDYAAKAIATFIEKTKGIKLINTLKEKEQNANILQKFWHWAKHTTMKSSDELSSIKDEVLRTKSTRYRAMCQLGNLAFSLLSLGIFIPLYTRTQTNKKQKEQELKTKIAQEASATFSSNFSKSPAFKSFSLVQN